MWADLVEDARRAPSPHNTQPWLVEAEDRTGGSTSGSGTRGTRSGCCCGSATAPSRRAARASRSARCSAEARRRLRVPPLGPPRAKVGGRLATAREARDAPRLRAAALARRRVAGLARVRAGARAGACLRRLRRRARGRGDRPRPHARLLARSGDDEGELRAALERRGALRRRPPTRARHRDRRVLRHGRRAEQLGARAGGAPRRPQAPAPRHPPSARREAVLRRQRVRARPVGDRDEPLDGDRGHRRAQVDGTRRRQDREDAAALRARLSLPDLRLPAVPQAARRLVVARLVAVRLPRGGRRRGDERSVAHLPPTRVPPGLQLVRRLGPRDQHRDRERLHDRLPPPARGAAPSSARRSACPSTARCRWSSSTTRSTT
jgi:hypothetical protein